MSIREDVKNDAIVYNILGYDPAKEIARLRKENKELKDTIQRMRKFKQQ